MLARDDVPWSGPQRQCITLKHISSLATVAIVSLDGSPLRKEDGTSLCDHVSQRFLDSRDKAKASEELVVWHVFVFFSLVLVEQLIPFLDVN
mmetsp:Transcript_12544/g.27458  ORF Transcript_12544/g.27458 Transcript_12544/m.27458 type:complete len:92 (-) Transcript_12544:1847-2122(-)